MFQTTKIVFFAIKQLIKHRKNVLIRELEPEFG